MSFNAGPPRKRQRGSRPFQTSPALTPSRAVSSPALVQPASTSTPFQATTVLSQFQSPSSMVQPKVKSDSADMQDSDTSNTSAAQAKTTEFGTPQAGPSQAEAIQDGVTRDGAHQARANDTGESQTPILTPIEISPPWKTAMACVSVVVGWPPRYLETVYGEIVSKKTREEIGTFIRTEIRGPPVCNMSPTNSDDNASSVWVYCHMADPSCIHSICIYQGKADALTGLWVTNASVKHVFSRNSKTCSLWVGMDADGYIRPCCEEWYACVDFKGATIPHEVKAFLLWVLDKDAALILANHGMSDKQQAELWRRMFKLSNGGYCEFTAQGRKHTYRTEK